MRVLAIIVNLFFPGVGTIIVGKTVVGIVQFLLWTAAVALTATGFGAIIGIPLGIIAWIWGIVSAATAEDKPLDSGRPPGSRG